MAWKSMRQRSFNDAMLVQHKALTELDDILKLIKWDSIEKHLVGLHNSKQGERAYPPLMMFKALLLQSWYNLSDTQLERQLARDWLFRRFVGIGLDGTAGLKAIKQHAGLALVQSPESAQFDSMPRSAINAGLADIVAPVQELPSKIIECLKHMPMKSSEDAEPLLELKSHGVLEQIVKLLRERNGNDFSLYKKIRCIAALSGACHFTKLTALLITRNFCAVTRKNWLYCLKNY